jgi:hypothetical protein
MTQRGSLFEAHHDDEVVTMMMYVVTTVSMVTLDSTPAQSMGATLHAGAGTHLLLPLPTKSLNCHDPLARV